AWISGKIGPLNDSAATVVRTVGTLKALAALASPVTLLRNTWISIDDVPNAICGWWSIMSKVWFVGVSNLEDGTAFA
ncbi:hypothetical protein, partial [Paenibacillus sp. LPE1-1-1.1]|uniref:hypothetical protein n=1 Tax=Paenibacillus sp. LPE1-1-1.1 TaxID=3135230 RepID=UPI0034438055